MRSTDSARNLPLSFALVFVSAMGIVAWLMLTRTPPSVAGGTRLVYSVDYEPAVADGRLRAEELDRPQELMRRMTEVILQRIDPSRGPFRQRKVGARVCAVREAQFVIELPPTPDAVPHPDWIAEVREFVETPAELEFYISAEAGGQARGSISAPKRPRPGAGSSSTPASPCAASMP